MSEPVPFANFQESGLEELGGASPMAMNVVIDAKGVVTKRPGIRAAPGIYSGLVDANGINGIHVTKDGSVFAVGISGAERPIYRLTAGAAALVGSGLPPTGLRGSERPTFAETEMLLVIAGGREPQKVELATLTSSRLGGSPPISTHIASLSNRLLLNDIQNDKTKVRYSDVALGTSSFAGHEVWSLGGVGTSGYITAEARPDDVKAIVDNSGEIWVVGQTTIETFGPDPVTAFARISSMELGCSAPYSLAKYDDSYYWLDHKVRFVQSAGRGYQSISDPIQRTIDAIETTDDCFGYHVSLGFLDALAWTFPTDARTFVWQKDVGWGQWSGFSGGNWSRFIVDCLTLSPMNGRPIVGTTTGYVGELSLDAATDLGDAIVARVTTGYLNRGTDNLKLNKWVRVVLRRGESGLTPGPQGFLRWRDRPGDAWSEIALDFGSSWDREVELTFHALGTYRYRQWEFEFGESPRLTLVSATEEFEVLPV